MQTRLREATFTFVFALIIGLGSGSLPGMAHESEDVPTGAFAFEIETELPAPPLIVWDLLTGDISGWWDHSMSEHPHQLFIEAKPGGGFWEIFDESGDGVRHAVVTYAARGKQMRMEGPLGLAGHAIHMVMTYELDSQGENATLLKIRVHASGEVHPGWPEIVEKTWRHFLFDRFVPYLTEQVAGE